MLDLTPEQSQALGGAANPRVRDPQTNAVYVLVREDLFEQMRKVADGFARGAGWDDPGLDVYERSRGQLP